MCKRILALVVIAMMILIPIAVFAGDTVNENGKAAAEVSEEVVSKEAEAQEEALGDDAEKSESEEPVAGEAAAEESGASVGVNNGTIGANNGTIDVNNGTIEENNGTVAVNNGTILNNKGTVETNNGAIENNNGKVAINNGSMGVSGQIDADTAEETPDANTGSGNPETVESSGKTDRSADKQETVTYSIIEGDKQTWKGEDDIVFLADGKYSDFEGVRYELKDSGEQKKLDASNFYAKREADTTAVTVRKEFLETLEPGEYELSIVYGDGEATTALTVTDLDQTPATGGAFPWIVLCAMMVSGAGMMLLYRRKAS